MAKQDEEMTVEVQTALPPKEPMALQVMYVGPSVPHLGLVQNRVYIGAADEVFASIKAKYPLVMQLVVPVEGSMRARADVNTPGTVCYMAAQQIMGGEA